MTDFLLTLPAWLHALLLIGGSILVAQVLHWILFRILRTFTQRTVTVVDDAFTAHMKNALRLLLTVLCVGLTLPFLMVGTRVAALLQGGFRTVLIIAIAWLLIRGTSMARDVLLHRYDMNSVNNLRARKIFTQIQFLQKILVIGIGFVALAMILMTFDSVRQLGTSILASAGVVGIIIGVAAQRSLATVLAGFQIALTQPIRIDDVVIVEGEWGRIEEITMTYVVVRIWDLRRLILPITYFIEKPFQNWTRVSADILGTVYLNVDYTVPVDALRGELQRILENSKEWDRKVCVLQVTNATERSVELRALMSAPDASKAWDLRCRVREQLISFVLEKYPDVLPRLRAVMEPPARTDDFLPGAGVAKNVMKK